LIQNFSFRSLVLTIAALAAMLVVVPQAHASFGFLGGASMHGGGADGDLLQFADPISIDRASNGDFYIVDNNGSRVIKVDQDGHFILEFGVSGNGDGQFTAPYGVAVAPNGNVYVADLLNNRIQYFTPDGVFIGKFGGPGTGDGQFNQLADVAVDAAGVVYAVDIFNHRIQYFSATGTFLGKWGTMGSAAGQFDRPIAISLDSDGTAYVSDRINNRVQYFAPTTHAYAGTWGSAGASPGSFYEPAGIFVNKATADHEVYVANDFQNHWIQRFSLTGDLINYWGTTNSSEGGHALGGLAGPSDLVVDGDYLAHVVDRYNHRVQLFQDVDGTPTSIGAWGTDGSTAGQFVRPNGVAAAADGSVYVADYGNNRVQHVSASGQVLDVWGSAGAGDGEFDNPRGIAVGAGGDVYVSDLNNARIQRFSPTGAFKDKWGTPGSANDQLAQPWGIDADAAGNIYVADSGNDRVVKFDADGNFITKWGQSGLGENNAEFGTIQGLAVNSAGTEVFVADAQARRVKKFDGSGAFLAQSGPYSPTPSSADGAFAAPSQLAVDPITGDVLVADANNNRVQRFSSSLVFISKFGLLGLGDGEFQAPVDIALDKNGNAWVSDSSNNRLQRFGVEPVVQILSPQNGVIVAGDSTPLSYSVSDPGATCDRSSGASAGPIAVGTQTLTVTCTNARGSGTASVSVTRLAASTLPTAPTAPSIKLPKKLKLTKQLKISATCPAGCAVTARLKIGSKSYKLKAAALAGQQAAQTAKLAVSKSVLKKGKAALKAKKKVTLTITVTPPGSDGAKQGKSGSVKITR
jgi:streptogramin lyase